MRVSKKLDLIGAALVFLSAFVELFVLDAFSAFSANGYNFWIMENQAYLSFMIRETALAVSNGGDLDQTRFAEAQGGMRLFSQTYDWATELLVARLITGATFVIGVGLVLTGKYLERD